jgi:hypothetical protein
MGLAWKVLLPIAFANLIVTGLVLVLGLQILLYVIGIGIVVLAAVGLLRRASSDTVRMQKAQG